MIVDGAIGNLKFKFDFENRNVVLSNNYNDEVIIEIEFYQFTFMIGKWVQIYNQWLRS